MQIFVKSLTGRTMTINAQRSDTVGSMRSILQSREGLDMDQTRLMFAGKHLEDRKRLSDYGIEKDTSLDVVGRLRGGVLMRVKMMTDHLPCGSEVEVDIDPNDTLREVKTKLEVATGVPVDAQKVLLAGIGEISMGDKRTNIKFSRCGTANNMSLATMGNEDKK